jgi:hypothetical protein
VFENRALRRYVDVRERKEDENRGNLVMRTV